MLGSLHWNDWAVLFVYVVGTSWLADHLAGRRQTIRDFFLGGRKLPWWAVCGSIVASEVSGETFVAIPAIAFAQGGNYFGGQTIPGVRLVVTDADSFQPVRTVLQLLEITWRQHPADFAWLGANKREPTLLTIDRLAGTDAVRKAVEAGTLPTLVRQSEQDVESFRSARAPYLLYQ